MEALTVAELIERLADYDADARVKLRLTTPRGNRDIWLSVVGTETNGAAVVELDWTFDQ